MELCYRLRTLFLRKEPEVQGPQIAKATFVEQFVVLKQDPLSFALPQKIPSRFEKRIACTDSIWIQSKKVNVYQIDSEPPKEIQKRTLDNVKDGLWLVRHDFLPKGGIPELNVPFKAMAFGIPISKESSQVIEEAAFQIQSRHSLNAVEDPCVVQHGTDRALVRSIVKDRQLKLSFGMLGNAIYLGSFWKAQRQAEMDAAFQPRDGALFRVFAWWPSVNIRMPGCPKCQCTECSRMSEIQGPDSVNVASDHLATWSQTHIAVWVGPWKCDNGKWTVKNDEFATQDPTSIFLESVAQISPSTDVQRDPLKRDLFIL